jgi:hypothetical protein
MEHVSKELKGMELREMVCDGCLLVVEKAEGIGWGETVGYLPLRRTPFFVSADSKGL